MATKNTKPGIAPPTGSGGIKATTSPPEKPSKPVQSRAKTAPEQRDTKEDTALVDVSPARAMQEQSITPPEPAKISVTLRTEQSYEYNLDLPRPVVENLLNPDVPDCFIEVPAKAYGGQPLHGTRRFLHTSYIKEVDIRGME